MALIGQAVSEKMLEIVENGRTPMRTMDVGYTLSLPCKPEGSDELKTRVNNIFGCKIFICEQIFKTFVALSKTFGIPEDQWSCKRSPDILA